MHHRLILITTLATCSALENAILVTHKTDSIRPAYLILTIMSFIQMFTLVTPTTTTTTKNNQLLPPPLQQHDALARWIVSPNHRSQWWLCTWGIHMILEGVQFVIWLYYGDNSSVFITIITTTYIIQTGAYITMIITTARQTSTVTSTTSLVTASVSARTLMVHTIIWFFYGMVVMIAITTWFHTTSTFSKDVYLQVAGVMVALGPYITMYIYACLMDGTATTTTTTNKHRQSIDGDRSVHLAHDDPGTPIEPSSPPPITDPTVRAYVCGVSVVTLLLMPAFIVVHLVITITNYDEARLIDRRDGDGWGYERIMSVVLFIIEPLVVVFIVWQTWPSTMRLLRLLQNNNDDGNEPALAQDKETVQLVPALHHRGSGGGGGGSVDLSSFHSVYELGERVGQGGFATVFKCTERSSGDVYAVKVMAKKGLSPDGIQRARDEISLLSTLSHPNICAFIASYEDDDTFYTIMPYLAGGELIQRIIKKGVGGYSEREVADVTRQVAAALEYIHSHHIIHRDVKPENLLFETSSEHSPLKLTDFGLAVMASAGTNSVQAGTTGYVSPEVVVLATDLTCRELPPKPEITTATDMWSLGVLLYILLCGFPPFFEETDDETFERIVKGDYGFPSYYWKDISDDAKDLVSKLLKLNPQDRISARDVLAHPWVRVSAPTRGFSAVHRKSLLVTETRRLSRQADASRSRLDFGVDDSKTRIQIPKPSPARDTVMTPRSEHVTDVMNKHLQH